MRVRTCDFDVARLWEPPANDDGEAPATWWVRPAKRKICRKQTKRELKASGGRALRDVLRRTWIAARCRRCGLCPKFIRKLPRAEAMAP